MIYKLKYIGDKVVIASLPLSSWTIVNTNTLSVSGNTVTQLGVGGWNESMYKSFTVPTSGSYTISYDYDIASGVVNGTYGFGLWLTTNNPNVSGDPQYQFYANSANRNGPAIASTSTNMAGMKGNITFTASLTANTTYYLWYPGAALNDGTTYKLTFRNIAVYNNPIQYTMDKDIKFNGTRAAYDYVEPTPPSSEVLYEDTTQHTTQNTTRAFNVDIPSYYPYIVIKFDQQIPHNSGASYLVNNYLNTNSFTIRQYNNGTNTEPCYVASNSGVTNINATKRTSDSLNRYLYKGSRWVEQWNTFKYVIQCSNGDTRCYIQGVNGVNYSPGASKVTRVESYQTTRNSGSVNIYLKNFYIAGFTTLEDALAY